MSSKNTPLILGIVLFIFLVSCGSNYTPSSPEEKESVGVPEEKVNSVASSFYDNIITAPKVVTSSSCDTDGGVNTYESGTVTTTKKGITTTLTDTCLNEKTLYEQYCTSTDIGTGGGTATINCLGSCESGACTRTFDATKCKSFGPVSARAEEDTINIIIVGVGYSESEEFIPYILPHIKEGFAPSFFSVEPWKSNQDAFNFYYVDAVAPLEQGTFSMERALPFVEHCQKPNKVIVFMTNHSNFHPYGSLTSPEDQLLSRMIGSAVLPAQYFQASINSKGNFEPARLAATSPEILVHELGHSIGGLRDEYGEEEHGPRSSTFEYFEPNCFTLGIPTTVEQCLAEAPWKDLISIFPESVGCFEGCNYANKNIYRPTEVGIMLNKDYMTLEYGGHGYGLPQERSVCCQILGKTGSVGGYCNIFNREPLHLVEYCQQEIN